MRKKNAFGKVITATSAACAVGLLLAGCGAANTDTAGGKPHITIMVNTGSTQISPGKQGWAKELAKEAGVDITWQNTGDSAWTNQRNAILASGDLADITIRGFSPSDAQRNAGAFEDLSKDLDKLPNVQAFFKAKPLARKLVEKDGTIYTLPSSRGKAYQASGQHMLINKAWLDKLGLEVPKTWDELTKVLEAFKTQDPNGNGEADEYPIDLRPLDTSNLGNWWSPFLFLNSTGIVTQFNNGPSSSGIYVENGKVKNWAISDEFRQVIEYLHQLTADGLAPSTWVTKQIDTYWNEIKGDGEKVGKVGVLFTWDQSNIANWGTSLNEEYIGIPVPAAPGVSQSEVVWDASREYNEYEDYKLSMSANTKYKDACLKVINLLYSEKYSVQQLRGTISEGYLKQDGHTYTVEQKFYDAANEGKTPALEDRLAGWIPDDVTIVNDTAADSMQKIDRVYDDQYANYDMTKDAMPIYVRLDSADTNTFANNNAAIYDYAIPVISSWIVKGGLDDASWNAYVKQLKSLNIDQNTEMWQKAYDEQVK
ncbi:extracellular solute-binding protein [Bifidobacterium sp. 82T10]|uniref:Extracellular solute-binding protein n=1 Tax=Bifidobacterium miconis TaxID=2834435 RepID=A0ABS6WHI2_9BIFI|nr:extracellular solute-binding protein [Bifidobacterium miconis]MBW3093511.1 extracellular solute-binding protein [Bifidobacterium miconis]